MRLLPTLAVLIALSSLGGAHGAEMTRAEQQAAGAALGSTSLSTGPLTPNASVKTATKQGAENPWGPAYTGSADTTLTRKQGAPSMIGIGNAAKVDAKDSFRGYTSNREDQASQATYFLTDKPVLKPTLESDDPIFITKKNLDKPEVFASSTSKICRQVEVKAQFKNTEDYTCNETYKPYVVSCSTQMNVSVSQEITCVVGQKYSIEMGDSSGMGEDDCDGGDSLKAEWTCTTADTPSITMSTGSILTGTASSIVPNNGSAIVNVDGSCAAKFINDTTCAKGKCNGRYTMILGANDPIYVETPQCHYQRIDYNDGTQFNGYSDPDGNECNPQISGYTFRERGFGGGTRINSSGQFSMSKTIIFPTGTSNCAALEGLE